MENKFACVPDYDFIESFGLIIFTNLDRNIFDLSILLNYT